MQTTHIEFQTLWRASICLFANEIHLISLYNNTTQKRNPMIIREQLMLNSRPKERPQYSYFTIGCICFPLQEHNIKTKSDEKSQATNIEFQTQRKTSIYLFPNGVRVISLYKNTTQKQKSIKHRKQLTLNSRPKGEPLITYFPMGCI